MVAPATGVALMGAAPVFADEIGDAAKKLAEASYPFAKEVDWNNGLYLQAPGAFKPLEAIKAIDKMILMGAQADPKLLKAAADAHHKAIGSIGGGNGVTSKADWEAVNAALGRVIASAPAPSGDKIGEAAKKLSDASYPFLKEVDWTSDLFIKPLPGASASQTLKAVDKAIVMGSAMDGNLLKAAAEAHHEAIGSIDGNGLTSAADYEAVNAALGRVVASVPAAKVMDVYNAFAKLVNPAVPNKLFSTVNALDANAAAKAFYEFKDVVKAAQR